MKKILLSLLVSFVGLATYSQVQVGTSTTTTGNIPFPSNWGYTYSQQLYYQSEINASGNITTVSFYYSSGTITNSDSVTIYLGHSTKTAFNSTTDWVPLASLTQVFKGNVTYPSSAGWFTITLDIPFAYNNVDNLVVAFEEDRPGFGSLAQWRYSSSPNYRSIYYRSDGTNPDPASPPTASARQLYSNNIIFGGITQSCPVPSGLTSFDLYSDSANITWVNGLNDSIWIIEYDTVGFTKGTGNVLSVNNDTIGLGGLTTNTSYDIYLRGVCHAGDSSYWIGPYTFSTPCVVQSVPYVQNFDGMATSSVGTTCYANDDLTDCWYNDASNTNNWAVKTGTTGTSSTGPSSDNTSGTGNYVYTESSSCYNNTLSMYTPSIDLSSLTLPQLTFYNHMYGSSMGTLSVYVSNDNGLTWSNVWSTSGNKGDQWNLAEVVLSSYINDTIIIKFEGTTGTSLYSDMAIDDILVDEAPSCPKVTNLQSFGTSFFSSNVTWTNGFNDSAWIVQYDTTGFTPGTGNIITSSNDTVALTGLSQDTDYDVYVRSICTVGDTSIWVGPISFTTLQTCPAPTALSTFAEGIDTAKVTWINGLYDSVWVIEYGVDGFVPGTGTILATDTNITDIYGLLPATDYDVYLRSVCAVGDTSLYVGPYSFTTQCPTAFTPPYLQDFATYTPICWSEAKGYLTSNTTLTGTTSNWTSDGFANVGTTGSARMEIYSTGRNEWLVSPSIDLGNGSIDYRVEFDVALTVWNTMAADTMQLDDSLVLVVSTDDGLTWSNANILKTWTHGSEPSATGDHVSYSLVGYTGVVKLGYYATSTISGEDVNVYIDNFWVREIPTCLEPSNLISTSVGIDSIDVKWTSSVDDSTWIVEYGTEGFALGTGTTVYLTADSATLNGLTQNTVYDIYVRSVCKSLDTSIWVGPITVNTLCDIQVAPYVQNFDGMATSSVGTSCYLFDDLTDCWSNDASNTNNWAVKTGSTGTGSTGPSSDNTSGTGNYVYTESSSCYNNTLSMYSPLVDLSSLTLPQLTFFNHMYGSSTGTLTVYVSNDGGLTWNSEWTMSGNQGNQWNKVELILSNYINDTIMLKIEGTTGTSLYSDMAIDDILLDEAPSCPKITNIESFGIEYDSANITWVNGFNDSSWIIEYDTIGFTLGTGNVISGTDDTVALTGLSADTDYEVYVRSICHIGDSSILVGPYTFRTLETCPQVDSIYAFATNYDSTLISWINGFYDSSWIIEWDTAGFTKGTGNVISGTNDTVTLLGINPNTTYDVYVRSICHLGDSSIWVGPYSFTTPCMTFVNLPYTETFDDTSSTQSCWRVINNNNDGDTWDMDETYAPYSGNEGVDIYTDYNSGNNDDYLVSPRVTLNGNQRIRFFTRSRSTFEPNDYEVLISSTGINPSDFNTLVGKDTIASTTYLEKIYYLNGYTGDYYVAIRIPPGGLDGYYLYVDEFTIEDIPSCPKPSNIKAYDAGKDSINLTWTPGLNDVSWVVEYGPKGFALGTGSTHLASNDTTTVSGLSPDVEYEFYVRGFCGVGDSSIWIGPAIDTTLPACIRTQSFTVLSSTASSIDVGWNIDPSHTTYIVEYGPTGYTPGMGDTLITAYPNNYLSVTGLSSSTEYDFYVKAVCSSGDTSVWDGPFTGVTACSTVPMPWTESFENVNPVGTGLMPLCMVEDGDWVTRNTSMTYNRAPRTGTNYVTVSYDATDWIFTPKFDLDTAGVYEFSFWYVTDGLSGWDEVSLHAGTDQASGSMTTVIGGELNPSHTTYKEMKGYFKPTTSGVYTFGVYVDCPSFSPWYLSFDDFGVRDTTQFVSVDELTELSQFDVYPNPNNGEFVITNEGNSLNTNVKILDLQGRVVYDKQMFFSFNDRKEINLNNVNTGMYLLQITSEGRSQQLRLVIE